MTMPDIYLDEGTIESFKADQWARDANANAASTWQAAATADAGQQIDQAASQMPVTLPAPPTRDVAGDYAPATPEAPIAAGGVGGETPDVGSGPTVAPQPAPPPAPTFTPPSPAVQATQPMIQPAAGYTSPPTQPAPTVPSAPAYVPPSPQAPQTNSPYEPIAVQAAQSAGIDPGYFVRQMMQESGLQPTNPDGTPKRSPAGAIGIAQFTPPTAQGVGVDPTDPQASLFAAAKLMKSYLDQYGGDWAKALAAYNSGPGNVAKYGGVPPFDETQSYVKAIMGGGPSSASAPTGQPQSVGRTSQFALGLDAASAYAACGPAAALAFAAAYGRNPTVGEAMQLAKARGWTPDRGMAGIDSEQGLLSDMGIPTKLVRGANWALFGQEAMSHNPVTISTTGHYFYADDYNPATNQFHVGTSGTDLKGGSEWMTPDQMTARMGQVQGGLLADHNLVSIPSQGAPTNPVSTVQDWFKDVGGAAAKTVDQAKSAAGDAAANAWSYLKSIAPDFSVSKTDYVNAAVGDQGTQQPPTTPGGLPPAVQGAVDTATKTLTGSTPAEVGQAATDLFAPDNPLTHTGQALTNAASQIPDVAAAAGTAIDAYRQTGLYQQASQLSGTMPVGAIEALAGQQRDAIDRGTAALNKLTTGQDITGQDRQDITALAMIFAGAGGEPTVQGGGLPGLKGGLTSPRDQGHVQLHPTGDPAADQAIHLYNETIANWNQRLATLRAANGTNIPAADATDLNAFAAQADRLKADIQAKGLDNGTLMPPNYDVPPGGSTDMLGRDQPAGSYTPAQRAAPPATTGPAMPVVADPLAEGHLAVQQVAAGLYPNADPGLVADLRTAVDKGTPVTARAALEDLRLDHPDIGTEANGHLLPSSIAQKVIANHAEFGGSTINPLRGDLAGQDAGSVSLYPERSLTLDHPPSQAEVERYIHDNRDLLADPRNSVGSWADTEAGQHVLDVVATPDPSTAEQLGRKYNQKAVFNLKTMEEIPTGGTGEGLPPGSPPIMERLDAIQPAAPAMGRAQQTEMPVGSPERAGYEALAANPHADGKDLAQLPGFQPWKLGRPLDGQTAATPPSADELRYALQKGLPFKDWYSAFGKWARDTVGPENLNEFASLFGVTSAQTPPDQNVIYTLGLMRLRRLMAARDLPMTAKNIEAVVRGDGAEAVTSSGSKVAIQQGSAFPELSGARFQSDTNTANRYKMTGDQIRKAAEIYQQGQSNMTSNAKTAGYSWNIVNAPERLFDPNPTIDTWMAQLYRQDPAKIARNDKPYRSIVGATRYFADEAGVSPQQAQAAQWFALKTPSDAARLDGAPRELKNAYYAFRTGKGSLNDLIDAGEKAGVFDHAGGDLADVTSHPGVQAEAEWWKANRDKMGALPSDSPPVKGLTYEPTKGVSGYPMRPITRDAEAARRAVIEGRASLVNTGLSQDALKAAGLDDSGHFDWFQGPHSVQTTAGHTIVTLPGGNADTGAYVASQIGSRTNTPGLTVHAPDFHADNLGGFQIKGDSAALDKAAASLESDGIPVVRGSDGTMLQVPHLGSEGEAGAAGERVVQAAKDAGLRPDAVLYYPAEVHPINESQYAGNIAALGDRFGSPERAGLPSDVGAAAPGEAGPPSSRFYHGTASDFPRPTAEKFDAKGLFGPGYYLTDSPQVAGGAVPQDFRGGGTPGYREGYAQNSSIASTADEATTRTALAHAKDMQAAMKQAGNSSEVQFWGDRVRAHQQTLADLKASPPAGPNVRAVDVPAGLNLLDADAPPPPALLQKWGEVTPNGVGDLTTGEALFRDIAAEFGGKNEATDWLAANGYDGVKYAGGQRVPMRDSTGQPIQHTAITIFPDSLGKLRNAISGTQGGSASIPFAGGAAAGGVAGGIAGYNADPNATQEERLRNAALGGAAGAVAGAAGGAYAGRVASSLTAAPLRRPGIGSNPPTATTAAGAATSTAPSGNPYVQAIQSYRYGNMLSGFYTHLGNTITNLGQAAAIPAHLMAEGRPVEAANFVGAAVASVPDAFQKAAKVVTSGVNERVAGHTEAAVQTAGKGFTHSPLNPWNVPTNLMSAADEFFYTMNREGVMRSLALRESGADPQKFASLLQYPSKTMQEQSDLLARRSTYTEDPGKIMDRLIQLRRDDTPAGVALSLLVPFVRTPANIAIRGAATTLRPITALPLIARAAFREGIGSDAVRQEVGKSLVAGVLWVGLADLAVQGKLSGNGPASAGERNDLIAQGWQPQSVKIGDKWVGYQQMGPLGVMAGIVSNTFEGIAEANKPGRPPKDFNTVAADAFDRFKGAVVDESPLRGLSAIFDNKTPDVAGLASGIGSSFIPFSGALRNTAAITDPLRRETAKNVPGRMAAGIPGLREQAPAALDVTGQPRQNPQFGNPSPFTTQQAQESVIGDAFAHHGIGISAPPKTITLGTGPKRATFDLTPDEQRSYQQYRGEALRRAEAVITGTAYRTAPPAAQKAALDKIEQAAAREAEGRVAQDIGASEVGRRATDRKTSIALTQ